jgi:flavin reductase ActVB
MARFASGVTIVTTESPGGSRVGFTASAFSSLSLDPPLILVCLERRAECFDAFMAAPQFAVSILASGQSAVAMTFATRGADKFANLEVQPGPLSGMPLVAGALAQLECQMHERLGGGDHVILVGEVISANVADSPPLLHYNRSFGAFAPG